jgi:hypothetical protein
MYTLLPVQVISFLAFVGCSRYEEVKEKLPFVFPNYARCNVVKLIDGDKFDCQLPNIQIERIKVIGVLIPASFKSEASEFTGLQLKRGLPVRLEPDQVTSDGVNPLACVHLPRGADAQFLTYRARLCRIQWENSECKIRKILSKIGE